MPVSFIQNASIAAGAGISTSKLGAGAVLQVVQGTYSAGSVSTTSTSYIATNLAVSITPQFLTSKILVITTANFRKANTNNIGQSIAIFRDSTNVYTGTANLFYATTPSGELSTVVTLNYLDSPATTSAISYSLRFKALNASNAVVFLPDAPSETATIIAMEIAS